MERVQTFVTGCCLALALAGCTRNTVIVLAPGQMGGAIPVSCWRPEDKQQHYKIAHETVRVMPTAPEIAKQQHMNGCAVVIFHLTKAGKPTNITLLRELPAGYGYGAAITDQVGRETFAPPAAPDDWYYRAESITFGRNAVPAPRSNQPLPAPPPPQQPSLYHG